MSLPVIPSVVVGIGAGSRAGTGVALSSPPPLSGGFSVGAIASCIVLIEDVSGD